MTITGLLLNLYSWCDRVSFSIKLFGPFWHVKGVILLFDIYLTSVFDLSLATAASQPRSSSGYSSKLLDLVFLLHGEMSPADLDSLFINPGMAEVDNWSDANTFSKVTENGYIHLSSHGNRDMNILAIENAMFPKIFFFSRSLGNFSRHGRPQKTSQTYLCPILPIL